MQHAIPGFKNETPQGVLYYLDSGECDVGTYDKDMNQTGMVVQLVAALLLDSIIRKPKKE